MVKKGIIGIVGGMGPMAAADMFIKLTNRTGAARDQDHAHVVIYSNTNIPDRTEAILYQGESPVPEIVRSCLFLEAAGADVLIMACNTAYHYYDDIVRFLKVPMLHMPRETAKRMKMEGHKKCAIFATDGTLKSGLYSNAFTNEGMELMIPDADGQKAIMEMIYGGVKAGSKTFNTDKVKRIMARMEEKGAEAFILGCTELPIAFRFYNIPGITADPTEILAEAALNFIKVKQIVQADDTIRKKHVPPCIEIPTADNDHIAKMARKCSISPYTASRLYAFAVTDGNEKFTSGMLKDYLGISRRSALRLISKLEDNGYLRCEGTELKAGKGRPSLVFKFDINGDV